MEIPVNIKTKALIGYSNEGENCYRCVLDTNQVIWITESGHSVHPSDIISWGGVDWHHAWQEKVQRNFYPVIKKPKAATIKAKRKHNKELSTKEFMDFVDAVWNAGGKKVIDGITWKITVE